MSETNNTNPTKQGGGKRIPLPADVSVLPDEKLIRVAEFHWGIYWKGLVVLAIGLLVATQVWTMGLYIMVIAGLMLGTSYLTKHYLLLILTDKRLLVRTGIIRMDTVQMALERIESVELERTIPGMILGYAAVVITGTGSRVVAVPFVDMPHAFRRLTDEQIYAFNNKDKLR